MTWDWVVQRTEKYCSIRRMEYPEYQTGIFGRMESALGFLGTGYDSDGNRQKEMQSQFRLDWALLTAGEKELNHRKARAYKTICVFDHSRYDCSSVVV